MISNVHISLTSAEPQVDSYALTLGYSPSVSHLSSVPGTYEQCYSLRLMTDRCLSQGLYPRVLTLLDIPGYSCSSAEYPLSDSSERTGSHPRGFTGVMRD